MLARFMAFLHGVMQQNLHLVFFLISVQLWRLESRSSLRLHALLAESHRRFTDCSRPPAAILKLPPSRRRLCSFPSPTRPIAAVCRMTGRKEAFMYFVCLCMSAHNDCCSGVEISRTAPLTIGSCWEEEGSGLAAKNGHDQLPVPDDCVGQRSSQ
ncbi:hypothetical protein B0J14DRAFT_60477 [Halenospora varia]|nr:hypothetical protein B0J14DRAFT_60477 [Halenospora varia]